MTFSKSSLSIASAISRGDFQKRNNFKIIKNIVKIATFFISISAPFSKSKRTISQSWFSTAI